MTNQPDSHGAESRDDKGGQNERVVMIVGAAGKRLCEAAIAVQLVMTDAVMAMDDFGNAARRVFPISVDWEGHKFSSFAQHENSGPNHYGWYRQFEKRARS